MGRWEQEQCLISVLMSCSSSGQTPHRGSITERAHCPQARTELPFFKKRQRGIPYVGCCSDEKPFHPTVFQSPLAALITGPGAALWAHCVHAGSWEKAARLILTTQIKTTHKYARHVRARTRTHACARSRSQSASCSGTFLSVFNNFSPQTQAANHTAVFSHFQSRKKQKPGGCGAADLGETFCRWTQSGRERGPSATADDGGRLSVDTLQHGSTMAVDGT